MHEIESADGSRPLPRCTSAMENVDHQSDGEDPTTDTAQGGDEDDVPVAPCELELVRDMVATSAGQTVTDTSDCCFLYS